MQQARDDRRNRISTLEKLFEGKNGEKIDKFSKSELQVKMENYRQFFMTPENEINLKSLIEKQEKLSDEEKKEIFRLHNLATDERFYGA